MAIRCRLFSTWHPESKSSTQYVLRESKSSASVYFHTRFRRESRSVSFEHRHLSFSTHKLFSLSFFQGVLVYCVLFKITNFGTYYVQRPTCMFFVLLRCQILTNLELMGLPSLASVFVLTGAHGNWDDGCMNLICRLRLVK